MNLHRQSIQSACASREIPLLAPCAVLEGCASSWPYNINLMPAPEVFADAVVNPLPGGRTRSVARSLTRIPHSARRPCRPSPDPNVLSFLLTRTPNLTMELAVGCC